MRALRMPALLLVLSVALASCSSGDDGPASSSGAVVAVTTTKAPPVRVTDLACQGSLDALRSVTAAYFAANARWPTRIGDLMGFVQLGGDATLSADGTVLSGVGWTATMTATAATTPSSSSPAAPPVTEPARPDELGYSSAVRERRL